MPRVTISCSYHLLIAVIQNQAVIDPLLPLMRMGLYGSCSATAEIRLTQVNQPSARCGSSLCELVHQQLPYSRHKKIIGGPDLIYLIMRHHSAIVLVLQGLITNTLENNDLTTRTRRGPCRNCYVLKINYAC